MVPSGRTKAGKSGGERWGWARPPTRLLVDPCRERRRGLPATIFLFGILTSMAAVAALKFAVRHSMAPLDTLTYDNFDYGPFNGSCSAALVGECSIATANTINLGGCCGA